MRLQDRKSQHERQHPLLEGCTRVQPVIEAKMPPTFIPILLGGAQYQPHP